jgi:hypothetical protein
VTVHTTLSAASRKPLELESWHGTLRAKSRQISKYSLPHAPTLQSASPEHPLATKKGARSLAFQAQGTNKGRLRGCRARATNKQEQAKARQHTAASKKEQAN